MGIVCSMYHNQGRSSDAEVDEAELNNGNLHSFAGSSLLEAHKDIANILSSLQQMTDISMRSFAVLSIVHEAEENTLRI